MGGLHSHHQQIAHVSSGFEAPAPGREPKWKAGFARFLGDDPDCQWGGQLFRVSNDAMLVCDHELTILYHNRAFLKAIGYGQGSFVDFSLLDFFPARDRNEADAAFASLENGRSSGLRIDATVLTCRGERQFEIRVVRSRRTDGWYNYYLVGRDQTERLAQQQRELENAADERILDGLPVAVWRTDSKLRITQVSGRLWETLGVDLSGVMGGDLTNSKSPALPRFLFDVDYCDTMAGLSLHSNVEWKGEAYEITVEPFVNRFGKVTGTLGMMRRSKLAPEDKSADHLQIPNLDPTEPIVPIGQAKRTRKIEIGPPEDSERKEDLATLRSNIRPRALSSTDIIRRPIEKPVSGKTEPVALAN